MELEESEMLLPWHEIQFWEAENTSESEASLHEKWVKKYHGSQEESKLISKAKHSVKWSAIVLDYFFFLTNIVWLVTSNSAQLELVASDLALQCYQ